MMVDCAWQGLGDSNPRPSVLETDALPTELHPFGPLACADLAVCYIRVLLSDFTDDASADCAAAFADRKA